MFLAACTTDPEALTENPVFTPAVHNDGVFELDSRPGVDGDQDKPSDPIPANVGDANTTNEIVLGDDWVDIYNDTIVDGTPTGDSSNAFAAAFAEDTFANNPINGTAEAFVAARTPEDTFYTGGGSKDTNGIQDGPWQYKNTNDQVPDKNDIVNAFAAAYAYPGPKGSSGS